jgi:hypothetical protein
MILIYIFYIYRFHSRRTIPETDAKDNDYKTPFKTLFKTPLNTLFKILLKIRMLCSPVHAWGRAHPAADHPASRSTSLKMADDLYVKG